MELVKALLLEAGLPEASVFTRKRLEIPGFYRPTKKWDLVVVVGKTLLATVEFKAHVGSFGNNVNNRSEEAIGSATDYWTAYREGVFADSARPWLGYVMLLEDSPKSRKAVRISEPHFKVLKEFHRASYAQRYEVLLTKLVRERLYDRTCLLTSPSHSSLTGNYGEPVLELSFANFTAGLLAHASAYARTHR